MHSVFDIIVIGGGIVGASTAMQLMGSGEYSILLLEKESEFAKHQTGNNSGVIHSGIYYKPGSLKAKMCVEGNRSIVKYCIENNLSHTICGKVIVATKEEQLNTLQELFERGKANGIEGIEYCDSIALKQIEPYVNGIAGLHVPSTGIVDYKAVTNSFVQKYLEYGGEISTAAEVKKVSDKGNYYEITTNKGCFLSRAVINCAGLYSDKITELFGLESEVKIIPFRGEYFTLSESARSKVTTLIYPVPDSRFPFLGVHFTNMIHSGVEVGPNAVLAFAREGYNKTTINFHELFEILLYKGFRKMARKYLLPGLKEIYRSFSKQAFLESAQELIPSLSDEDLQPGGAGVRAQAVDKSGKLVDDFVFAEHKSGSKYVLNVVNAPSPAATASLEIGKTICSKVISNLS